MGLPLQKLGFGILWLAFVGYAFFLAPPDRPDTLLLIQKLAAGQWDGINAAIVALFNLMGILPAIYACLLFSDGRGQKYPAWLFVLLSFFVGAFAILPYLALRSPNPTFIGRKDWFLRFWDSRWTGAAIAAIALVILSAGFRHGNGVDFIQQWQTSRFIHVMGLDFCLLSLLLPSLLGDDMLRRGVTDPRIYTIVGTLPLIGPLLYLCLRPPLTEGGDKNLENVTVEV